MLQCIMALRLPRFLPSLLLVGQHLRIVNVITNTSLYIPAVHFPPQHPLQARDSSCSR